MKTSLSYLPQVKQDQILQIVAVIKEIANPEKIILFGSYAKGTFIEHEYIGKDGIRYEYISDYDFLVVTKDSPEKAYILDNDITTRAEKIRPALNIEIHDIDYINEGLEFGQYFFTDIVKEGILLYNTGKVQFVEPKELSDEEKKKVAERYFDIWFPKAVSALRGVNFYLNEGDDIKFAAFLSHQAAESFYYTMLLVYTGYKPKTHSLNKLRKQSKILSKELFLLFQIESDNKEKHLFDLLRRGYVDARYRNDYFITKEEMNEILQRLKEMENIVKDNCQIKINS